MRLAPLFLLVAACGEDGPIRAIERGRQLFSDPAFSDSGFNDFSCATCHTTTADGDAPPRIAVSLYDVAGRTRFWGGFEPTLLEAVNACASFFMRSSPIGPEEERGRALFEYLVSISPGGPLPGKPLTVVENVTTVPRGDPARGREVWDRSCRVCHGDPHSGDGRLSSRVAIVPEASHGFAGEFGIADPAVVITEKVRHGQFFGVGGNMPFFSLEALPDADLGALQGYLATCPPPAPSAPRDDSRPATIAYLAQAVLRPSCATASCHNEDVAMTGLVLEGNPMEIRASLLARSLVYAGQPAGSPLLHYLRGACGAPRMPPDGPLPEADIALVERWISAGAP